MLRIIYDDLIEFAEVRIRCEDTRRKDKCCYCPFYDRCEMNNPINLHIVCAELEKEDSVEIKKGDI